MHTLTRLVQLTWLSQRERGRRNESPKTPQFVTWHGIARCETRTYDCGGSVNISTNCCANGVSDAGRFNNAKSVVSDDCARRSVLC